MYDKYNEFIFYEQQSLISLFRICINMIINKKGEDIFFNSNIPFLHF